MAGLIGAVLVCTPFIGTYYGVKWIYNQTPWSKRKKEELDWEIKELEKQLKLVGRDDSACNYDPYYYYKQNNTRKEYLECLRKKVAENYQSLDIILAIKEMQDRIGHSIRYRNSFQVLMLANRNIYEAPIHSHACESIISLLSQDASAYFRNFHNFRRRAHNLKRRLRTLSECGRYEDYFVVTIPGKFEREKVGMKNEKIKLFVENFRKKYRKDAK